MSKKTRKIEDLSLDEFLQHEYRKITRHYPFLAECGEFWGLNKNEIAHAKAWVAAQAEHDALYDARPSPDEQRAMLSSMELAFVDQDAPIAVYPEADTVASEAPCAKAADLLRQYNSSYQYGRYGTFANSPGERVRAEENAWIAEHAAREAARAAVAMAA